MSMVTVKVSNVSLQATEGELKEFFSFSGDIVYLEIQQSENEEGSKLAYVTFKDLQGAETAILLSGAMIVGSSVTVTMSPEYQLPPDALVSIESLSPSTENASVFRKGEDVVRNMISKGFRLGKDAKAKAKILDEKINTGTTVTKSAIAATEQTVNNAGSAIMKKGYVLTGATWVLSGAFHKVSKAAEEVSPPKDSKLSESQTQTQPQKEFTPSVASPQL